MTTRQSLEASIAKLQSEIDAMVVYPQPGGNFGDPVPFDHEKKVLTLMSLRDRDIRRLRELNGEKEGEL